MLKLQGVGGLDDDDENPGHNDSFGQISFHVRLMLTVKIHNVYPCKAELILDF